MEKYKMYIGGEWVDSVSGEMREVLYPSTQEALWEVPDGVEEDVDRAVEAALKAWEPWAMLRLTRRIHYLRAALELLEDKKEEMVEIMVKEGGHPISLARWFFEGALGRLRATIEAAPGFYGETIPSTTGRFSCTIKQPIGVVGAIVPWNAPLTQAINKIAPALVTGNTMVLKPSMETPISALELAKVFEAVELPKGVFNVVTGSGLVAGKRIVENPKVSKISFTGDTATGRDIAERAGRTLKKLTLELGGSDPLIVCEDANIDWATDAAVYGRFYHQGQICISSKRIILLERIAEEFKEKMLEKTRRLKIGDPMDPKTQIGPLINKQQTEKVHQQVKGSINMGAKLLCGGRYEKLVYEPTILGDCTMEMPCCREECFGPVAPLITVPDFDTAIEIANDTIHGLSGGIFTQDLSKAMKAITRIQSGSIHVNECSLHIDPFAPFGGVKASGMGKELGGHYAFEEYTNTKWVTINIEQASYPFLRLGDKT